MRGAAVAVVVLVMCAARGWADAPRAQPIGFDHTLHERDVIVSGGESIACAKCHDVQRGAIVGKPGHAACFGACHGAALRAPARGVKLALDEDRLKLCTNCHAEAALVAAYAGKLAVPYPPYTMERDFSLVFGHKAHAGVSACTACHAVGGVVKAPPAPHARCAGCHDGAAGHGSAMTECTTCHQAAVGKPQPPELAVVQDSVTAVFSHPRHAARGGAGKDCLTCHAGIAATDATELPRPTATECARCHDGAAAFGVTAQCTKCHAAPAASSTSAATFTVARPDARFRHGGPHAQIVAGAACASCHGVDRSGDATAPPHAACVACHAADFGARKPETCGACHIGTEPWRPLRADRPPPDESELGATIDHAKHKAACETCHALRTKTAELQLPRGHAACTGGACHSASTGPAPNIVDCAACHQLGRVAARAAVRAADPWSVRDTFSHASHTTRAGVSAGSANAPSPACIACHDDLAGADVVKLASPPKRSCAPCHDGARAFNLTGTTCKKCHTR